MPPKSTPHPPSPLARNAFLFLAAGVPLIYHAGLYEFSLLPKRLLIQAVLLVLSCAWVMDLRAGRSVLRSSPLYLPLFCYLLWSIVSLSQATHPLSGLVAIGHQITFVFVFFLAFHLFPPGALPAFLRISAGVGIFVSLIGIAEWHGIGTAYLPLSNGRPSATFAYRNFAAAYLIMNLPLALALAWRGKTGTDTALGLLSTALMSVFLIYTRTRGAWVGFAFALLIIAILCFLAHRRWSASLAPGILRTSRPAQGMAALALLLCVALAALPPAIASPQARAIDEQKIELLDALSSIAAPSGDRGRLALWKNTLPMIADHPLLGVGSGNWCYAYPPYDGGDMVRAGSAPQRPHNDYLWIASETGLPGLFFYIWFLIAIAGLALAVLRTSEQASYALAIATGLLAMLGYGLFEFPRELAETSYLFWFGLGVLASMKKDRTAHRSSLHRRAASLAPVLLFLCLYLTYRQMRFDHHYLRAFEYERGGHFSAVLVEASRALQWGPFDPQAFFFQGQGYQASGMLYQAERAYETGLRYAPHDISLLGALGTAHALQNRLDQAEAHYRAALAIYPQYYEMYNNLGGVYQTRGNFAQAIDAYRTALSYNRAYLDAWSNLGLAYMAADSADKAIEVYQTALTFAPDDPILHHDLGEAHYRQALRDPEFLPLALASFERFLSLWQGAHSETAAAHQRIADIRKRLSGESP